MHRRLKLILILIVAAAVGITAVLASWLYGSYSQRMALFLATAERALFDAIQETVQQREGAGTFLLPPAGRDRNKNPRFVFRRAKMDSLHTRKLTAKITEAYPAIDPDSLTLLLDSLFLQTRGRFMAYMGSKPAMSTLPARSIAGVRVALTHDLHNGPRQLLPNFLFGQLSLDSSAFHAIEKAFAVELAANGIHTDFAFHVITADKIRDNGHAPADTPLTRIQLEPVLLDSIAEGGLAIRPILVDPENGKFIAVAFNRPWQYLLYNLSWQLIISVALVVTIVGCFVYLFHTIFKQNRLALLRKTFVNNMTHELRTPVATVSAAVQALQSYAGMEDEKRRDLYLSISREELDHLASMIDDVLQVVEGDHRAVKQLQYQHYDIISLVQKCVEKAKIKAQDKHVAFTFSAVVAPEIYGDPEHMQNVITNLFDNAVKYGATQISVTIKASNAYKFVELYVQDNGIGIPHSYHQRVFEPFFRIPQRSGYTTKGFGLGLSYVKQVVAQHGGTITLDSTPGEGSLFILSIPKKAIR